MSNKKIGVSFWGSPYISAQFLEKLCKDDRFEVKFVVSQEDKARSRRGREVQPTPVKQVAIQNSIDVYTPKSIKKSKDSLIEQWAPYNVSFHVIFAYGKIIPTELYSYPELEAVNFHASLLPLLRGASPIEHSLIQGFTNTGWTLQRLAASLDTGNILWQSPIPINEEDNSTTLYSHLLETLLKEGTNALREYANQTLKDIPQDDSKATHCGKITPQMGEIHWNHSAFNIRNLFRGLQERPGVYSTWADKKVKLYLDLNKEDSPQSELQRKPGEIVEVADDCLWIACGDNECIPINQVQLDGKKRMSAKEFINGYHAKCGSQFALKS